MTKRLIQQILPAMIMVGAAAVPIATTGAIISQSLSRGAVGGAPSTSAAALPPSSSGGTAKASSSGTAQTSSRGGGTYQGPAVQDPFGTVQAAATIANGKISNVSISAPQGGMSGFINGQAVPLLRQETLQAQSANVNAISGATLTSQAYIQSLQGALAQAQHGGNAPTATSSSASTPAASGNNLAIRGRHDD